MQTRLLERPGYEAIHLFEDPARGARLLIAVHSTLLGPALGGCRALHYPGLDEALTDVARLAEGMTFKNALAGVDFGGGKSVLLLPQGTSSPTQPMLEALGDAVEQLAGSYVVTEDMGMTTDNLEFLRTRTSHLCGCRTGPLAGGHPGPYTAHGLHQAMEVTARQLRPGRDDPLPGLDVVISGLGSVGEALARSLARAGCTLRLADIRTQHAAALAQELGARAVEAEGAHRLQADLFSPNARGACFDDQTIPQLGAKALAGAANNQLAEPRHAEALHRAGILYAPDYLVNAGGVLSLAMEAAKQPSTHEERLAKVEAIGPTLQRVFERAQQQDLPPARVAEQLVRERLEAAAS